MAHRAHIPLAATTYYFESLGDLLSNAVGFSAKGQRVTLSARRTASELVLAVEGFVRL